MLSWSDGEMTFFIVWVLFIYAHAQRRRRLGRGRKVEISTRLRNLLARQKARREDVDAEKL